MSASSSAKRKKPSPAAAAVAAAAAAAVSSDDNLLLPPDSAIELNTATSDADDDNLNDIEDDDDNDDGNNEESKLLEESYDARPRRRSFTSSGGTTKATLRGRKQSFADALFGHGLGLTNADHPDADDNNGPRDDESDRDDDGGDDQDEAGVDHELSADEESDGTVSNSSSDDDAAVNWAREMAAKLSLLRENEDDLQVLLMGNGPNLQPVSLDAAVAICRKSRRNNKATEGQPNLWLDFCNHSARDVEQFRRALAIHPVTIEDCVLVSREKCESFRRYTVVVVSEQYYRHNSIVIDTAQTTILVFEHITLSFRTVATSPSFLPVAYRLVHGENKGIIPSAHWVMYAFLDEIVARFDSFTEQIVNEVMVLDDLVLQYARSEQNDLLRRVNIARRRLATLQGTLLLKRGVLETLCRSSTLSNDAIGSYLRDVLDECAAMMERLVVTFEVLNHLDSIYMTRLSLEVAQSGESMNVVMKKFSAVATIFLPLSTLAGVFGMNVQVPGQGDIEPTYWWFIGIILCMVVSSVLVLWYFIRNNFW